MTEEKYYENLTAEGQVCLKKVLGHLARLVAKEELERQRKLIVRNEKPK